MPDWISSTIVCRSIPSLKCAPHLVGSFHRRRVVRVADPRMLVVRFETGTLAIDVFAVLVGLCPVVSGEHHDLVDRRSNHLGTRTVDVLQSCS